MATIDYSEGRLSLAGCYTSDRVSLIQDRAHRLVRQRKVTELDPSGIERIDSAGVAFVEDLILSCSSRGSLNIFPARPEIQAVMDTFRSIGLPEVPPPERKGFFELLGGGVLDRLASFGRAVALASEICYWSAVGLFDRSRQRPGVVTQQALLLGNNALPIIALLSFIIGFIISLQSGIQLRIYGGDIFLADLLSVTLVREMAPLITAILVAGRSGSAIASEIATMQVSEELDALRMMALSPIRYVVVPKFHAITFVMPILVMFSILFGELGGAVIAFGYLDLSLPTFVSRSLDILTAKDLIITFSKSVVFAWLIVIIGAHYGFQVRGGAEGVGKATTASVVSSIFAVVIADSLFSLLYI